MLSTLVHNFTRHHRNTSFVWRKSIHTRKLDSRTVQYSLGIVTVTAVCGIVVYFEHQYLDEKFTTVTNVFENEKHDSKYIYIDPEKQDLMKVKNIPWLYKKEEDHKSLLRLTRSTDFRLRCLGVRALSEHHDWQDYQFRSLAQALDSRALIGLARSEDVDHRFFLPMPRPPPSQVCIEDEYITLLSSLEVEELHKCLKYYTSKALQVGNTRDEEDSLFSFGGTGLDIPKAASTIAKEKVEIICLQALASHSVNLKTCKYIVDIGGIQLLQQTYNKRFSIVIQRQIAKILGNLAVHQCCHKDIIRAGWITILAEWIGSSDLTLSLHAARTLANLDREFVSCIYEDGIYLIHPTFRKRESIHADVVFVHGLLGGPFKTWRQQDRNQLKTDNSADGTESLKKETYTYCWPKDWLAKDCPNIRILSVEYDTDLSTWNANCPFETEKRSIAVRALNLLQKLEKADIGSRPIIWIGHSMGGDSRFTDELSTCLGENSPQYDSIFKKKKMQRITNFNKQLKNLSHLLYRQYRVSQIGLLIKQMLSTAVDNPKLQNLVNNTAGVVFYSTPHRGSTLAHRSNQASFIVAPTIEVQEMGRDSQTLRKLHKDFQQMAMDYGFPCLSFGELEKTLFGTPKLQMFIVEPESSDPGIGRFYGVKTNHLNVCKPWDKESEVYQETLKFIYDITTDSKILKNSQK